MDDKNLPFLISDKLLDEARMKSAHFYAELAKTALDQKQAINLFIEVIIIQKRLPTCLFRSQVFRQLLELKRDLKAYEEHPKELMTFQEKTKTTTLLVANRENSAKADRAPKFVTTITVFLMDTKVSVKDFWEKYDSALEAHHLLKERNTAQSAIACTNKYFAEKFSYRRLYQKDSILKDASSAVSSFFSSVFSGNKPLVQVDLPQLPLEVIELIFTKAAGHGVSPRL